MLFKKKLKKNMNGQRFLLVDSSDQQQHANTEKLKRLCRQHKECSTEEGWATKLSAISVSTLERGCVQHSQHTETPARLC